MPTYKQLRKTVHKHYMPDYWAGIHALYEGGYHLLNDKAVLARVFPRHLGEEDQVYEERCKRAFYIPYFGQIVDFIVASLGSDPLTVMSDPEGNDEFYEEFFKDTSRPGGERVDVNQLVRQQVLTALLCRRSWALVDFPNPGDDPEPLSLAEEEDQGRLRAYVVPLDPESVLDWERDASGELLWANVMTCDRPRASIESNRNTIVETFTVYDREGWKRYEVQYDVDKQPPNEEDQIPLVDAGRHSFGRVPICELALPKGLWIGNRVESIARELFNKRSALSWGQYRSLFQMLVATLAPPDPLHPTSEDTNRAVNTTVGPGRMYVGAQGDDLKFIGPSAEPFRVAMDDLQHLRDEMFRVVSQMAQSVDNTGAALKRSAESKMVDMGAMAVVLRDLGRRAREHCQDVYEMVSRGRGDKYQWKCGGMDHFDEVSMDMFVQEAAIVDTLSIPSASFQQDYKFELARRLMPGASDDRLQEYKDEIEENVTPELFVPIPPGQEPDGDEGPGGGPAAGTAKPAEKKPAPEKKGKPAGKSSDAGK